MSATFIIDIANENMRRLYWSPFMAKFPEYEYLFNYQVAKYPYVIKTMGYAIPAYDTMAMLPSLIKNEEVAIPKRISIGISSPTIPACILGPAKIVMRNEEFTAKIKGSVYIL